MSKRGFEQFFVDLSDAVLLVLILASWLMCCIAVVPFLALIAVPVAPSGKPIVLGALLPWYGYPVISELLPSLVGVEIGSALLCPFAPVVGKVGYF